MSTTTRSVTVTAAITIRTGGQVTVGSGLANSGNVIAGNGSYGISIIKIVAGDPDPANSRIARNWIGTNAGGTLARGNGLAGIRVEGARHEIGHLIDGVFGIGNVIAHNGNEGGVRVIGAASTVQITENVIRDNIGPGIDLGGDGSTPNDPGDADVGPNLLLNYPVLAGATNSGNATTVFVDTSSLAEGRYEVELFSAPACNPAGFAQAAQFLLPRGQGVFGNSGVQALVLQDLVPAGHYITAAALGTTPDGWLGTSELSPCIQVDPTIALTPNPFAAVTNTSAPMTVTLSQPAGAGGQTVNFVSNDPAAAIQSRSSSPQGASAGTVTITTGSAAGTAIITATAAGFQDGTANVNVSLRSMTLSAAERARRRRAQPDRNDHARTTGADRRARRQSGAAATRISCTVSPANVTIAQGATTGTFTIRRHRAGLVHDYRERDRRQQLRRSTSPRRRRA